MKKWPQPLLLILEAPFRLPGRLMHPVLASGNGTRDARPRRQSDGCRTMPCSLILGDGGTPVSDGASQTSAFRFTDVWVRDRAGWRVISRFSERR